MRDQTPTEAAINLRAEHLGVTFPDGESFDVTLERVLTDELTIDQAVRRCAVEQALVAAMDFCLLDDSDEDAYLCTLETVEALPIFQSGELGNFDANVEAAINVAVTMLPKQPPRKPMPVPPSARI